MWEYYFYVYFQLYQAEQYKSNNNILNNKGLYQLNIEKKKF